MQQHNQLTTKSVECNFILDESEYRLNGVNKREMVNERIESNKLCWQDLNSKAFHTETSKQRLSKASMVSTLYYDATAAATFFEYNP